MSKNIYQVYLANPITTNASTDLIYFGQSPYGSTNDAAMTYANFAAQFGAPYTVSPNTALETDGSGNIVSSTTTSTELGYVHGVTSSIQTQLNNKQPLNSNLTDISGLSPSLNNIIYGNGSNFVEKALTGNRIVYVDANGSDSTGDGSILFPFATIYKANSVITGNNTTTRWVVSIGAGKFIETNNILLKPYTYYVGRGGTASYIVSPNGLIGPDPEVATQTSFIGMYGMYVGSTTAIDFNLPSLGGSFSCVLEMVDIGLNAGVTFIGRDLGADFLEWDSGYTASGSVSVSNAQGFLSNVLVGGSLNLDTAISNGHTLFTIIGSQFTNLSIASTSGIENTSTIASSSNSGTFSADGATTTVNIDAVSLPTLISNYSSTGGAVVNFTTEDWGIAANYTPTHYTPTSSTVDGNFQGIDNALGSIESGALTWSVKSSSTSLVKGNGFFANSGSTITFTLPTTAAVGDTFAVSNMNSGNFVIAQNAGQSIRWGNLITTTGTGGNITSTSIGDGLMIVCNIANTGFQIIPGAQGQLNIT